MKPPLTSFRRTTAVAITTGTLVAGLGGAAAAGQPTHTGFFAAGAYPPGTIEGVINVCPDGQNECISSGSVRVKLLKLRGGQWEKVAAKQATDEGQTWSVRFRNAPTGGRCKMVARFSGTSSYEPSKGSTSGRCADENWQG